MKKIISLVMIAVMLMSLAACGNNVKDAKNEDKSKLQKEATKEEESTKEQGATKEPEASTDVKSDGYEKFSQLKIGMTESDVNAILGEPKNVDKAYYYYDIVVNGKDLEITVWINTGSGKVTYISGDFYKNDYRDEFVDATTDLSNAEDLENDKIKSYEDCVSTFKTSGYLISIDEDGRKSYLWVDSNRGYMIVVFKADGSIHSYNGFC